MVRDKCTDDDDPVMPNVPRVPGGEPTTACPRVGDEKAEAKTSRSKTAANTLMVTTAIESTSLATASSQIAGTRGVGKGAIAGMPSNSSSVSVVGVGGQCYDINSGVVPEMTLDGLSSKRQKLRKGPRIVHTYAPPPVKNSDDLYQCSECDKAYKRWQGLSDHHRNKHTNESWQCTECDKTFKSRSGLRDHLLYKHSDERPLFECSESNAFFSRSGLSYHIHTHLIVLDFED